MNIEQIKSAINEFEKTWKSNHGYGNSDREMAINKIIDLIVEYGDDRYAKGLEDGLFEGRDDGYGYGYDAGYDNGYDAGYNHGVDVDRD